MLNFLSKRYWFFALSVILILPGLFVIAMNGLPLSIDFIGGSLVEVSFSDASAPTTEDLMAIYNEIEVVDAQVQTSIDDGSVIMVIKSSSLDQDQYANYGPK